MENVTGFVQSVKDQDKAEARDEKRLRHDLLRDKARLMLEHFNWAGGGDEIKKLAEQAILDYLKEPV